MDLANVMWGITASSSLLRNTFCFCDVASINLKPKFGFPKVHMDGLKACLNDYDANTSVYEQL